jgi:hypothetical protein
VYNGKCPAGDPFRQAPSGRDLHRDCQRSALVHDLLRRFLTARPRWVSSFAAPMGTS